jgi:hypothetical protein
LCGALSNTFHAITYAPGIADFNHQEFIYPYRYKSSDEIFDKIDQTSNLQAIKKYFVDCNSLFIKIKKEF